MSPLDPRQRLGRLGEDLAQRHFERLGFTLVERNARSRHGELDLVLCDGETLVFCEVKTRRAGGGAPFESLGPAKRRQVRRMAQAWLARSRERPRAPTIRFDAVAVTLDRADRLVALEHLEAAF